MALNNLLIRKKISDYISNTGLVLIGIVCSGYLLFYTVFAKLNIMVHFLSVPLFVGEILLILCLILLLLKFIIYSNKVTFLYDIFFCFSIFLAIKTFLGYQQWGTLAFRHSALFFYTLFVLIGYSFFNLEFFKKKINLFILITTFFFVFLRNPFFNEYYFIMCFILFFLLIRACPRKALRLFLVILLLGLSPYRFFIIGPRANILGIYAVTIFIICVFLYVNKSKVRLIFDKLFSSRKKVLICVILFIGLCLIAIKNNDIRKKISFIWPRGLIRGYIDCKKRISLVKDLFKMEKIPIIRLYSTDKHTPVPQEAYYKQLEQLAKLEGRKKNVITGEFQDREELMRSSAFPSVTSSEKRDLELNLTNALFRIFIWEDILEEIAKSKLRNKIFGIDFGKAFRSKNIEILCWAAGEWGRDGWISPHNSYFEIFYRAGLIGILLIIGFFLTLIKMIRKAFLCKSLTGIALCAIFVNWIVAANFMPLFEMPYLAIPFWSLFGMSLAYIEKECKIK